MESRVRRTYLPRFTIGAPRAASAATLNADESEITVAPDAQPTIMVEDLPSFASNLTAVATPGIESASGVPRDQFRVPISPVEVITDQVIFEGAVEPASRYYVPRYKLGEQIVSGQAQFRISLEPEPNGGHLSLYLDAFPAPEIATESRAAQAIDHEVALVLRYQVPSSDGSSAQEELAFQEVTKEPSGTRAVLRVENLAKLTQLFSALTDPHYDTTLLVRRTISVAVPAPAAEAPSLIVSTGKGLIRGTRMFDFDAGVEGTTGDVWWEQQTQTDRKMVPQGGAQIVNLGVVDFDALSVDQLQSLSYTNAPIDGTDSHIAHAILSVTPNRNPSGSQGMYNNHPIGVSYDGQRWSIYNQDLGAMLAGAAFNVEVRRPSDSVFVHRASSANTIGHYTYIDHPLTNVNPNAILSVTSNWNPGGSGGVYNNHPIGVSYDGQRWLIYNQDLAAMPDSAAFNVVVLRSGDFVFVHRASHANIRGNYTDIDHPLINGNPYTTVLLVTPNRNPGGGEGVYNNHSIGVWFNTNTQKWSIYNQDLQPMPEGAAFNVEILRPRTTNFIISAGATNTAGHCIFINHASAKTVNQFVRNDVFAVITKAGNYAKVLVREPGSDLTIRWITYRPPAWLPGTPLFREVALALDDLLAPSPFVFPPEMHPYIFRTMGGLPGRSYGFIHRPVEWNQQSYSYYQDEARPYVFKYLPDGFKITRRKTSPHYPYMAITIAQNGSSIENAQVTIDYKAAPFVEQERLAAAAGVLVAYLPSTLPAGIGGLVFEPLLQGSNTTRLRIKRPGTEVEDHTKAVVDLRTGIDDMLTLSMEAFRTVFNALISRSAAFFEGWVEVDVGDRTEKIPFTPRMDDLVGELFDYTISPHVASGGLQVMLRNAIESPLRLKALTAQLRRGDAAVPGILQGLTLPADLAPGEALTLVVAPAQPFDGAGALAVVFDLDEVEVLLDPAAVLRTVLAASVAPEYTKTITVRTFKEQFDPPPDRPGDQVMAIVIDFEHGESVALAPDKLEAQAKVRQPLDDYILPRESQGQYRYWITIVRKGRQPQRDERTDRTLYLFPDVVA